MTDMTEREVLEALLYARLGHRPKYVADAILAAGFTRAMSVTDEQVERMAREYMQSELNLSWEEADETTRLHARSMCRYYLRAALEGARDE